MCSGSGRFCSACSWAARPRWSAQLTPVVPQPDHDAVPDEMAQLLERARAIDPAARYASAGELGAALWTVHNAWFEARNDEPAVGAPTSLPAGGAGRRRALIIAGVLGVLAAGSAVGSWRTRSTSTPERPLVATVRATALPTVELPRANDSITTSPAHIEAGTAPAAIITAAHERAPRDTSLRLAHPSRARAAVRRGSARSGAGCSAPIGAGRCLSSRAYRRSRPRPGRVLPRLRPPSRPLLRATLRRAVAQEW